MNGCLQALVHDLPKQIPDVIPNKNILHSVNGKHVLDQTNGSITDN